MSVKQPRKKTATKKVLPVMHDDCWCMPFVIIYKLKGYEVRPVLRTPPTGVVCVRKLSPVTFSQKSRWMVVATAEPTSAASTGPPPVVLNVIYAPCAPCRCVYVCVCMCVFLSAACVSRFQPCDWLIAPVMSQNENAAAPFSFVDEAASFYSV